MSEPTVLEYLAAVRKLFYGRLAEHSRDLNLLLSDLAVQIENRNDNMIRALLAEVESKTQTMHNIFMVLDEYLEG